MKLQKVLYATQKFLKRNGSIILTVVGICGGVYAAVKAVKDTPKAMELLAKAKESVDTGTMDNHLEEESSQSGTRSKLLHRFIFSRL